MNQRILKASLIGITLAVFTSCGIVQVKHNYKGKMLTSEEIEKQKAQEKEREERRSKVRAAYHNEHSPSGPITTITTNKFKITTCDFESIREEPGTKGQGVYGLEEGSQVEALAEIGTPFKNIDGKTGKWTKIRSLDSDAHGWIFGGCLKPDPKGGKISKAANQSGGKTGIKCTSAMKKQIMNKARKNFIRQGYSGQELKVKMRGVQMGIELGCKTY